MNIQINLDSSFTREYKISVLNVIAHSVDGWIDGYEKNHSVFDQKGRVMQGTMINPANMLVKCNGKTMFIKVRPLEGKK